MDLISKMLTFYVVLLILHWLAVQFRRLSLRAVYSRSSYVVRSITDVLAGIYLNVHDTVWVLVNDVTNMFLFIILSVVVLRLMSIEFEMNYIFTWLRHTHHKVFCRYSSLRNLFGLDCRSRAQRIADLAALELNSCIVKPIRAVYNTIRKIFPSAQPFDALYYNLHAIWPARRVPFSVAFKTSCLCIIVPTLSIIFYATYTTMRRSYRYFYSVVVHRFADSIKTQDIRRVFREKTLYIKPNTQPGHTHPVAAALRSSALEFILENIRSTGRIPYSVSMSRTDARLGLEGSREYHWSKDLNLEPRNDRIGKGHALVMIDVDYYVDMREYAKYGLPIYLFTFDPYQVASKTIDGQYYIRDDYVNLLINGGARYTHKLWDYHTDIVSFDYIWGTQIFGIEQKRVSPDRTVVILAPIRTIWGPFLWGGDTLKRRKITHKNVNVMQRVVDGETELSLSRNGSPVSVSVPYAIAHTIVVRCNTKKNEYNLADIERNLRPRPQAREEAGILFGLIPYLTDYFRIDQPILSTSPIDLSYQSLLPLSNEDGKKSGQVLSKPLVTNGVYAPDRSLNNDTACITGRIDNVINKKRFNGYIKSYQREFLALVLPDERVHTGVPYTIADIREIQNRPTQRAQNEEAEAVMFCDASIKFVEAFQKSEAYPSLNYPRNITTLSADHRLRYGGFIRSFADHVVKEFDWYAFGKTPNQLATAVYDMCSRTLNHVLMTDFSKFDGTHSEDFVNLEQAVLLRYFAPEYHGEIVDLLRYQYNCPARTSNGAKYNTSWTRLSGSSDTSLFNTIDNAFVAYCVNRSMGHNIQYSWANLGLYGGDDGLSPDTNPETYARICKSIGLAIKPELAVNNDKIVFLGRLFPNPWVDPGSICDPLRQARKFHYSSAPDIIPRDVAIRRKADGLLTTDYRTPVIRDWALAVNRIVPKVNFAKYENHLCTLDSHWSRFSNDVQFPPPELDEEDLRVIVAESFGVTIDVINDVIDKYATASSIDDFPSDVIEKEIETVLPVVLRGEIVEPIENLQNETFNRQPEPEQQQQPTQPDGAAAVPTGSNQPTEGSTPQSDPQSSTGAALNDKTPGTAAHDNHNKRKYVPPGQRRARDRRPGPKGDGAHVDSDSPSPIPESSSGEGNDRLRANPTDHNGRQSDDGVRSAPNKPSWRSNRSVRRAKQTNFAETVRDGASPRGIPKRRGPRFWRRSAPNNDSVPSRSS